MSMSMSTELNRRHWLAGALLWPMAGAWASTHRPAMEVWKDPSCDCCKDWVEHLEKSGFAVRVFETGRDAARARIGIPDRLGSCHTGSIGGYAIEGHVPAQDIKRLLREKPRALGLAVPGMPVGSPGMDGPVYKGRKEAYDVLLVLQDGRSSVYQRYARQTTTHDAKG